MAPAAMGGIALASYLANRHEANKAAMQTPQEQRAAGGQEQASQGLMTQGQRLGGLGMPALQQGLGYFSSLASGNRQMMQQALAPQVQQINQVYGGTRRTLARFLRGPDRDYQLGELERERSGGVASLFRDARGNATARLLEAGGQITGQGIAATGAGGGLFGQLAGQQAYNRLSASELQRQAGADTGRLLFALLQAYQGRGAGGRGDSGGTGG